MNAVSAFSYGSGWQQTGTHLATMTGLVINPILLLKWFITKKLGVFDVLVTAAVYIYGVILIDVTFANEMRPRVWPFAVLVLDILLLCSVPTKMVTGILTVICLYLVLDFSERVTRFGLYDMAGGEKMKYVRTCHGKRDFCVSL